MSARQRAQLHRGLLVRLSLVALLAALLQVLTASPASAGTPTGDVNDVVSREPGRVHIRGWALDPTDQGISVDIHVYFNSPGAEHGVNLGPANAYRPDVPVNSGYSGNYHGFDAVIDVPLSGDLEWRVYAIDPHGGPNPLIEAGRVTIADPSPRGAFEGVSSPGHRQVAVWGWAGDPSNPQATLDLEVYIGGPAGTAGAERHLINTSVERQDVTAAHGFSPRPGFVRTLTTGKTGRQVVHIYAVNHPGSPGTNTHIGYRTIDIFVDTTPPETAITAVPRYATTNDVIRVEFIASESNATFQCRWDEAPWAACAGSTTISLAPGNHMISVRASDVYGNVDTSPATAVVTVTAAPPPPPPPPSAPAGPTVEARAVKKKSKLRIDIGPDSGEDNYRVVIQRKVGTKWRKVDRVRTRGDRDVVVVDLRRGTYRAVLPAGSQGAAVRSSSVRLKR